MHVIGVGRDVFEINNKIAERNRKTFDDAGVLAINFMGAIGSGKTAMIEILHKKLKGYRIAAIAGDIVSDLDANRLKKLGIPVVGVNTGKECHLDASVRLVGPALIGEKGKIEKGATLKDYVVLGDRVTVGSQTILSHTIILEGTRIGSHVSLAGCIIGRNCSIEDEVVIEGPLVLADGSTVKKGTRLC